MTNALWYLGRGTGVSALVLLTMVLVLGVVVRGGRPLPGLPRFAVAAIHRTTSLTALGLIVVHVATMLLDPYAQLRLADIVLPFRGAYRPLWLGLGTLAADLIVVLIASSLLREKLGRRTWRALHWAAYACWPLALTHALGTGTDRTSGWILVIAGVCIAQVAGALAWRGWLGLAGRRGAAALAGPLTPGGPVASRSAERAVASADSSRRVRR